MSSLLKTIENTINFVQMFSFDGRYEKQNNEIKVKIIQNFGTSKYTDSPLNKEFSLYVSSRDTFRDIRIKLLKEKNVISTPLNFFYGYTVYSDDKRLDDYGLTFNLKSTDHIYMQMGLFYNIPPKPSEVDAGTVDYKSLYYFIAEEIQKMRPIIKNCGKINIAEEIYNEFNQMNELYNNTTNMNIKPIKLKLIQLFKELPGKIEKDAIFAVYEEYFTNTLKNAFIHCQYFKNEDKVRLMYEILLICVDNGFTFFRNIFRNFYPDQKRFLNLYSKLVMKSISINPKLNKSILVCSTHHVNLIVYCCWFCDLIADWQISPQIIKYGLLNGWKFIHYLKKDEKLILEYLQTFQTNYVSLKLNCYLFVINKLYKEIKNGYYEILKKYIHSKQSIRIIINYVMNDEEINDNNIITKYITNIQFNSVRHGFAYLNEKNWKYWKAVAKRR